MEPPFRETLPKKERICGKKDIENLLAKGKHGRAGDIKYCALKGNGTDNHRIMVSVPKKLFRRAVKRNLLKRRIRESYRRLKYLLGDTEYFDILFIYGSKDILPYSQIYDDMSNLLNRLGNAGE